jgi:hypothetical protein
MKARAAILTVVLPAILVIAVPVRAQDELEPQASIRLVSQTAWTTPKDPLLKVNVRLRNDGTTTIEAPELVWTLGGKIGAREEYEQAIVEGPTLAAADTTPLEPLEPGVPREVHLEIDTGAYTAIDQTESGVYPLQLELRSAGTRISAVTTAEIHVIQRPQARVRFSWWTEIDAPVAFAPDGSMIDPGFERALETETGIVAQVNAIAELVADLDRASDRDRPAAVDLVVAPVALEQLEQAADGFRRPDGSRVSEDARPAVVAAETLDQLRTIASSPDVGLYATPFSAPRLPSLLSPDLRSHLVDQWRLGDETVERILGEPPDHRVVRPPGLALDEASLDVLADRGVTTILGAADSVPRPTDPLDLAPPPAARISSAFGADVDIVLPDPSTQALLEDRDLRTADPVRAAQVVLGELATIWRELPVPSPPDIRGLALDLPRDLPATMWGPLLRRLTGAPFLEPVHAQDLPGRIQPQPARASLDDRRRGGFSPSYEDDLSATARDVTAFASMVEEPEGDADRLRRDILYAESSQYIGNEAAGRMWIDAVNFVTDRAFAALAPDTSRVLTFTSRSGRIPLRLGDPGDRTLQVQVELRSTRVDFLDTGTRTVRLDEPNQVITFDAEVKASGRSSIDVFVLAPSGLVLSRSVLVVRSTAINPIALIITIGAGLVLVGLWSRRLFRRRNP